MYVRDNNKCIQNSSDIYLKKKISFKKMTSITCSNKVITLKKNNLWIHDALPKKKINLAKNINKITTVFWCTERHFTYTFYIQM